MELNVFSCSMNDERVSVTLCEGANANCTTQGIIMIIAEIAKQNNITFKVAMREITLYHRMMRKRRMI